MSDDDKSSPSSLFGNKMMAGAPESPGEKETKPLEMATFLASNKSSSAIFDTFVYVFALFMSPISFDEFFGQVGTLTGNLKCRLTSNVLNRTLGRLGTKHLVLGIVKVGALLQKV